MQPAGGASHHWQRHAITGSRTRVVSSAVRWRRRAPRSPGLQLETPAERPEADPTLSYYAAAYGIDPGAPPSIVAALAREAAAQRAGAFARDPLWAARVGTAVAMQARGAAAVGALALCPAWLPWRRRWHLPLCVCARRVPPATGLRANATPPPLAHISAGPPDRPAPAPARPLHQARRRDLRPGRGRAPRLVRLARAARAARRRAVNPRRRLGRLHDAPCSLPRVDRGAP